MGEREDIYSRITEYHPKRSKQESVKQAKYMAKNIKEAKLFPKRIGEVSRLASRLKNIGKGMGKLGVAGNISQGIDWALWQAKEAKRKKKGVEPEV